MTPKEEQPRVVRLFSFQLVVSEANELVLRGVGCLVAMDAAADSILLTVDARLLSLCEVPVVLRHVGLLTVLHGRLALLKMGGLLRG